MLLTLNDAKNYAISRIEMLTGEQIEDTEKRLVEILLETKFFDIIKDRIDEQELENMKLTSPEQVEGYLFDKLPNYTSILEEVTIDFLSDYLSGENSEEEME